MTPDLRTVVDAVLFCILGFPILVLVLVAAGGTT